MGKIYFNTFSTYKKITLKYLFVKKIIEHFYHILGFMV